MTEFPVTDRKQRDFDLIVLGGGSGGLAGAFRAASYGKRVAMMEPGELGGTCVNVGCVPKKAMWLAADLAQRIQLAASLGFITAPPRLQWKEMITHRQRYIANIHQSYRKRLDGDGIVHLPTRGRLLDAHHVESEDGIRFSAEHILIATGGRPARPDIAGAEHGLVSDDFFSLCDAPERVALIGGGYIAVELAGILQALGSQVEMFVRGERLLQGFDAELVEQLHEDMRQHGVHVHFGNRLRALQPDGNGKVRLRGADDQLSEAFDTVLFATGRRPNTAGIGLEQAGVATDERGHVVVDDYQNTSVGNLFAVGDVTPRPALTPVAIAAARKLMDRVYGGQADARLDYDNVPTVVFAHPPLGRVGLGEEEAHARYGDNVRVYRTGFRPMLHALADSPQRSLFKLVCAGEDERVVGIHLLGDGADEILQGFAVALKRGVTKRDLEETVAIHPTSAEEIVLMR